MKSRGGVIPNASSVTYSFPFASNWLIRPSGPSLESFTRDTPLTVGTPEQVIERTLGFADYVGDYQRQLFLVDHAGLPLNTVLEQIEILGKEVVPVLRREFEARRPAHVPSNPPSHASLLAEGPDSPHRKVISASAGLEQVTEEASV